MTDMHTARVAPEKAVFRPALPLCSSAGLNGTAMGKKTEYWELLRDPRWQRRRLEIMNRDEFSCKQCHDNESTLNVHHKHYIKGRAPWEYEDHELVTLCEPCHEQIGEQEAARKEIFAKLRVDGPYCIHEALALVAGWASNNCGHNLSHHQDLSPYNFVLGEVTDLIDVFSFNVSTLLELRDALIDVPADQRKDALADMVKALRARGRE